MLVPTRELALQVHKSLSTYGVPANMRVTAIFGGVSIVPQKRDLQRGVDIIVATPGRLLDHMEQRTVDLSGIEILTLDEADRMLDMGFLPPLRRILKVLPRERQTLLFSATISPEVVRLSADFTRDPQRVDVSEGQVMAQTVTHRVHPVSDQRKGDLLTHVLTQAPVGQALVFCKTKHGSNRVGQYLERAGVKAAVIHGNKSQGARTRALDDFKAGRVSVLVATDIAARGLDIVAVAAGRELRPADGGGRLHSPRRPHRPGGFPRPRGFARVAGGSRPAARHPAPAAGAGGARRRRRLRGDALRRTKRCPKPGAVTRATARVAASVVRGRVGVRAPVEPDAAHRVPAVTLARA